MPVFVLSIRPALQARSTWSRRVDVRPAQREGLAGPQARVPEQEEEVRVHRGHALGGLEEGRELAGAHRADRLLALGRREPVRLAAELEAEAEGGVRHDDGVIRRAPEHGRERGPDQPDTVLAQSSPSLRQEEGLDRAPVELAHPHVAQRRRDVPLELLAVAHERARLDLVGNYAAPPVVIRAP
jgi:hypothetical protein